MVFHRGCDPLLSSSGELFEQGNSEISFESICHCYTLVNTRVHYWLDITFSIHHNGEHNIGLKVTPNSLLLGFECRLSFAY